jgi:type I restriction enzyme S subunit
MSWEKVRLEEVCKIVGGTTPSTSKAEFWNGDIIWLSPVDLPEVGSISIVNDSLRKITFEAVKSSSLEILPINSIVFSTRASIGKIGIVKKPLCTNQGFTNLIPREKIYFKYLAYALKNNIQNISRLGNSTTFNEVSRTAFKNFQIPLPPLATQKRIAEILDAADALRRKDQELLKKYDELAQAIFIDMFGDPVKNQMGWDVKRLDELLLKAEKISYGVVQPGDEYPNGIPIVRVGDFKLMKIDKSNLKRINPEIEKSYNRTRLKGDEILIACVGSVGKIALADDSLKGFNIVRATAKVRVDENITNRTYLAFHLSQKAIQNYFISETRTSSQPTLNIKQIEETKILIPPIELQNKFSLLSFDLLRQIELLNQADSENVFNSLIQKAFKGELVS